MATITVKNSKIKVTKEGFYSEFGYECFIKRTPASMRARIKLLEDNIASGEYGNGKMLERAIERLALTRQNLKEVLEKQAAAKAKQRSKVSKKKAKAA